MRELQRIFTYFNQATTKNTCQIFLPKKSRNRSFKSKKSFDNPRHLKFEVECGTKPERAGKNKEGGEGEGKEGRVSFVLSPSPRPTPLLFLLLNPLCPVPTIWTPGTGYMLWNLVLPLGKRSDQLLSIRARPGKKYPKKCSKNLSGNSQFFPLKIHPKISKYSKNFLKIPKHPKNFLKNPEYPKIF